MRLRTAALSAIIVVGMLSIACGQASPTPALTPPAASEIPGRDLASPIACLGVVQLREDGVYIVINLGAVKGARQFIPTTGQSGGFLRLIFVSGQALDVTTTIEDILQQIEACKKGK